jgi:hypothetical protein
MAAAAYAAEHPGKWNIKGLVASHGASGGAAPNLTMPSMFCSGGEDRRGKNRQAFNACPSKWKVFAEVNGARHMEPAGAGRLNPFDAHFLGCHVANLTTSCDKIYGNAPDSICHAGEALNYTMKSCDIVQPSTATCNIQPKVDCGGDFFAEQQVDDVGACCDLCKATANCNAWTHSLWNDKGKRSATCYLKKACGTTTKTDDSTSGTVSFPSSILVMV